MGRRLVIGLALACLLPSATRAQDAEADIHVIVTSSETASGGGERAVALIGYGRFEGMAITIGLLNYLSSKGGGLAVNVEQMARHGQGGPARDRWNFLYSQYTRRQLASGTQSVPTARAIES